MKKIPTIFDRDWNGDRSRVVNKPHTDCGWVFAGQDADEFCRMKALLTETHDVLLKVLGVTSDRDAAHAEITGLMQRIREVI